MKTIALMLTTISLLLTGVETATTTETTGTPWVYDELQAISEETEEYITALNEVSFPTYKNKPQLGIMVISELPAGYTMDEYKLEQFNLYGVGTRKENCGMLFVLAINDREYGLEIGDGFEKGSLLREDLETDFITPEMKTLLQQENYDAVVMQVAEHLCMLMMDEESGVYAERETAYAQRQEETLQQLNNAVKFLSKAFVWFIIVALSGGVLFAAGKGLTRVVSAYKRKKLIKELMERYSQQARIVELVGGSSGDYLLQRLTEIWENVATSDLEQNFLNHLHRLYISCACMELKKIGIKYDSSLYEERLKEVNNFQAFSDANVTELDSIIREVDKYIEDAQEIERQNHQRIHDFTFANASVMKNKGVSPEDIEAEVQKHCRFGVVMTDKALNEAFQEEFKEAVFRHEYDLFIKEHKDSIDAECFDSQTFYNSLRNGKEYESYDMFRNREWMLPLFLMHMENRRREIREYRERRRQQEQRRREEEARREREERSSYSSFGSGFGGGHSSGGGFSGGW